MSECSCEAYSLVVQSKSGGGLTVAFTHAIYCYLYCVVGAMGVRQVGTKVLCKRARITNSSVCVCQQGHADRSPLRSKLNMGNLRRRPGKNIFHRWLCAAEHTQGLRETASADDVMMKVTLSFRKQTLSAQPVEYRYAKLDEYSSCCASFVVVANTTYLKRVEEERIQFVRDLDVKDSFPLAAATARGCQP